MTTNVNRRITYDYRNVKVAGVWIFVAIVCVVTIISLYNQYVAAAKSISIPAQNSISEAIAPPKRANTMEVQATGRELNASEVNESWAWVTANCKPHPQGGFDCTGNQVVAIDSDGGLMIVTGESNGGWDVISLRTDRKDWIRK